jgi:hypothetical protein
MGALRTGLARADVAIDADATENMFVVEVISGRVAQFLRIFQLAAQ